MIIHRSELFWIFWVDWDWTLIHINTNLINHFLHEEMLYVTVVSRSFDVLDLFIWPFDKRLSVLKFPWSSVFLPQSGSFFLHRDISEWDLSPTFMTWATSVPFQNTWVLWCVLCYLKFCVCKVLRSLLCLALLWLRMSWLVLLIVMFVSLIIVCLGY